MDRLEIELPLPPSVNASYQFNPKLHRLIKTPEYSNYIKDTAWIVKDILMQNNFSEPIDGFYPVYMEFFLRSKLADSHNYKKPIFDALERGGLFTNDKYILDRTVSVNYDKNNPRVICVLNLEIKK